MMVAVLVMFVAIYMWVLEWLSIISVKKTAESVRAAGLSARNVRGV
ncbi:hypothetical protein [Salmonella phage ZCSE7]|nr:hypothetical protein [Salmonella phage ZCSE7]